MKLGGTLIPVFRLTSSLRLETTKTRLIAVLPTVSALRFILAALLIAAGVRMLFA